MRWAQGSKRPLCLLSLAIFAPIRVDAVPISPYHKQNVEFMPPRPQKNRKRRRKRVEKKRRRDDREMVMERQLIEYLSAIVTLIAVKHYN